MTRQRTSRKSNGHPGPTGHPNGHAPAYAERGGAPAPACASRLRSHAASDDASGISVASAEAHPATVSLLLQASTGRVACADAAPPAPNEISTQRHLDQKGQLKKGARKGANTAASDRNEKEMPPGKGPLPQDPADFVQEIHTKIDLTEIWHSLLRSKDEKIRQRAAERLTAMLYDDGAISAEEPQQIVWDFDSAAAPRAAEGAKND